MRISLSSVVVFGSITLAVAGLGACSKEAAAPAPIVENPSTAASATPAAPVAVATPAQEAPVQDTFLQTVYFDYDSSSLTPAAQDALRKIASSLKSKPATKVQIEGHCDERGSAEYNLALGARRAHSVEEFLKGEGVSASDLASISKGKEFPAVQGEGEAVWSKNRRAEFLKLK